MVWKPGQSGNPGGRVKLPEEVRKALRMTKVQVETTLAKYLGKTREELSEAAKDPSASSLEIIIISIMMKAMKDGDQHRLDFLLNRMIGKVKDELDITTQPRALVIERPNGMLTILGNEEDVIEGDIVQNPKELPSSQNKKD